PRSGHAAASPENRRGIAGPLVLRRDNRGCSRRPAAALAQRALSATCPLGSPPAATVAQSPSGGIPRSSFWQGVPAELTTHRAECSSMLAQPFTVRDVGMLQRTDHAPPGHAREEEP